MRRRSGPGNRCPAATATQLARERPNEPPRPPPPTWGSAVAAPHSPHCLTGLYDPEGVMKESGALEKEWGVDILDRMQAKAAQRAAEQAAREEAIRTGQPLPGGDGNAIGAGEAE